MYYKHYKQIMLLFIISLLTISGAIATSNFGNISALNVSATNFYGNVNASYVQNPYWYNSSNPVGYQNASQVNTSINNALTTIVFYPNSSINITGTINSGGNNGNMSIIDGYYLNLSEIAGSGFEYRINFTNVNQSVTNLQTYFWYNQNGVVIGSHVVSLQIWNYNTSVWETYLQVTNLNSFQLFNIPIGDSSRHINNSIVQVRFIHSANGNGAHQLYVNEIQLQHGLTFIGSGQISDPNKLDVTDQRYNDTALINSVNTTAVNAYTNASLMMSYNSTLARTGNCAAGSVVQNTTTSGVQCVAVSATGDGNNYTTSQGFNSTGGVYQLNTAITGRSNLTATFDVSVFNDTAKVNAVNTTLNVQTLLNLANITPYNVSTTYFRVTNIPATCVGGTWVTSWNGNGSTCTGLVVGDITALGFNTTTQLTTLYNTLYNDTTLANTKALPGNCPSGQVVQNTTTSGVQCVVAGGSITANSFQCGGTDQMYNVSITSAGVLSGVCSAQGGGSTPSSFTFIELNATSKFNSSGNTYLNNITGTGNVNFDGNTFVINSTSNYISIGMTALDDILSVNGSIAIYSPTSGLEVLKLDGTTGGIWTSDGVNATGTVWSNGVNLSNKTAPGTCSGSQVVQNTTLTGVQCITPTASAAPAGVSGNVQYNNNSVTTGAVNVNIDSQGYLLLSNASQPTTPTSGTKLYSRDKGLESQVKFVGISGIDRPLQPSLATEDSGWCSPAHSGTGTTAATCNGLTTGTVQTSSTVSNPAPANTVNLFKSSLTSATWTSATTANATAGIGGAALNWMNGNNTNTSVTPMGGYKMFQRVSWSTMPATGMGCVGMFGSTAIITVNNQSCAQNTNSIYFGWDRTNTTMGIWSNDASGTATNKLDCGANYPSPIATGGTNAVYSVTIFARPSVANVSVFIDREDLVGIPPCYTTLNTDIPLGGQLLTWKFFCSNGGTTSACAVDMYKVYMSKDN